MNETSSSAELNPPASAAASADVPDSASHSRSPRTKRVRPLDPEGRARLTDPSENPTDGSDGEPTPEQTREPRPDREVAQDCASVARLALLGVEWLRLRKRAGRTPRLDKINRRSELLGRAVARRMSVGAGYVIEWVSLAADVASEFVEDAMAERQIELASAASASPAAVAE